MKPKEKAKELVKKYLKYAFHDLAKGCSIICCDEIIEYVSSAKNDKFLHIRIEFWESVKEEIKKL